jgi:hypothetical protein
MECIGKSWVGLARSGCRGMDCIGEYCLGVADMPGNGSVGSVTTWIGSRTVECTG